MSEKITIDKYLQEFIRKKQTLKECCSYLCIMIFL